MQRKQTRYIEIMKIVALVPIKLNSERVKEKNLREFSQTTEKSGYSVPDFEKIALAYGIKAATLPSYESLDEFKEWVIDNEPCVINITMPEDTLLIPKIKWETGRIMPLLDNQLEQQVSDLLSKDL